MTLLAMLAGVDSSSTGACSSCEKTVDFLLTLSDLGGADSAPPPSYIFIYTFFRVCWMPLRFSKFNFLSYSNETLTSLVFYFQPCLHGNQVLVHHSVKNIHFVSLNPFCLVQLNLNYEFTSILIYRLHFYTKIKVLRTFNTLSFL